MAPTCLLAAVAVQVLRATPRALRRAVHRAAHRATAGRADEGGDHRFSDDAAPTRLQGWQLLYQPGGQDLQGNSARLSGAFSLLAARGLLRDDEVRGDPVLDAFRRRLRSAITEQRALEGRAAAAVAAAGAAAAAVAAAGDAGPEDVEEERAAAAAAAAAVAALPLSREQWGANVERILAAGGERAFYGRHETAAKFIQRGLVPYKVRAAWGEEDGEPADEDPPDSAFALPPPIAKTLDPRDLGLDLILIERNNDVTFGKDKEYKE